MSEDQNVELHQKLNNYSNYWNSQKDIKVEPFFASMPPFNIINKFPRKLFDWNGKKGIFIKNAEGIEYKKHYLSNSLTSSEIDQIKCENQEEPYGNVRKAFEIETRQRIYKNVYKGNIFDDMMPIESKSYMNSLHLFKFLFIYVLLLLILVGLMLFFSYNYHIADNKNAILKTYNGYYAPYINKPEYFNDISKILKKELKDNKKINQLYLELQNTGYSIQRLPEDSEKIRSYLEENITNSIRDIIVGRDGAELDTNYFNSFLDYAIFFTILQNENNLLNKYVYQSKMILIPTNNTYENISQIALFTIAFVFLIVFFNMKTYFFNLFQNIKSCNLRIEAITLFEILTDKHFNHRKKFHYFMAFVVSSLFVIMHAIGTQEFSYSIGILSGSIMNVEPYDYRLHTNFIAVFYIYWATQLSIVYFIILTGWEIRQLALIKTFILKAEDNKYSKGQKDTDSPSTFTALMVLVVLSIVVLVATSYFKYKQIPIEDIGLYKINHYLYIAYTTSPAITISLFTLFVFFSDKISIILSENNMKDVMTEVKQILNKTQILNETLEMGDE